MCWVIDNKILALWVFSMAFINFCSYTSSQGETVQRNNFIFVSWL
ncbi:hypothetical protein BSPLISOX_248 [uncultured Gammaproteobacteria bacterium]|nr:hypothetical protein BSPLISOX_248 [uncultured Gammaproteobacteria bacterium]